MPNTRPDVLLIVAELSMIVFWVPAVKIGISKCNARFKFNIKNLIFARLLFKQSVTVLYSH